MYVDGETEGTRQREFTKNTGGIVSVSTKM